jgi:hypothetical protein
MPRFIDMTDAQKAQVWKRHVAAGGAGSPAAELAEARRELAEAEARAAAQPGSLLARAALRSARERLARAEVR